MQNATTIPNSPGIEGNGVEASPSFTHEETEVKDQTTEDQTQKPDRPNSPDGLVHFHGVSGLWFLDLSEICI